MIRGMARIYLSPPDVGDLERTMLLEAFDSGWIAPVGPELAAFEAELAAVAGVDHAVAVSSGSAALHLALVVTGVGAGDRVLVPTLTFAATANVVTYVGAEPTFVDADAETWTIDAALVAEELAAGAARGRPYAAVLPVDLYGQCADYDALTAACDRHGAVLIEDAAEALGATYRDRPAGSFGQLAAFSFNGNKTITTSGGGMLVGDDEALVEHARHLATQAREPVRHYEHREVGFNYRLSNLLAAVGRAQLRTLTDKVAHRRAVKARYAAALADLPGVALMPDAPWGTPSNWLTVLTLDPAVAAAGRDELIEHLEAHDVEARPAWKPMHLQPVFADRPLVGGAIAAGIFERGVCLPSGSSLSAEDQDRVVALVREVLDRP